MGWWFNNFTEFEKKRGVDNNLVLNFYYVPDEGEESRSVKVFVPYDVRVPSSFMIHEKAQQVVDKIKSDEILGRYRVEERKLGRFGVLSIQLPKNSDLVGKKSALEKIHGNFHMGNYDKLLRFGGFYPERKVEFNEGLEKALHESDEIQLESYGGINFNGFPTEKEICSLPYIVIDIEKPLWKKDDEKKKLDLRNKLLKHEEKYERLTSEKRIDEENSKHIKRERIIGKLEENLRIDVEGVGNINLYEDECSADVSFVGTIWGNVPGRELFRELYVIDPRGEIKDEERNGFKVLKYKTEKELVQGLLDNVHERKPVISYGHNQVYDITQLRFASETGKITFDPAVSDIKPRRDFVRQFLQRLREDLIYIDTLWLSKIYHPYLAQRRFGTNYKLDSVAKHVGLDFTKSLSHDELRIVELKRLFGRNAKTRRKAIGEMLDYTTDDLDNTLEIANRIDPWPLLTQLKEVLPFCTYSELAFSSNVMNKLHEWKHFNQAGNLPFTGYKQKQRLDELMIFKKRFPSKKRELLRHFGIKRAKKGEYESVQEFYLPLESWMRSLSLGVAPELRQLFERTKDDSDRGFAFLQYMRAFMNPILTDYYFARRDQKTFEFAKKISRYNGLIFDDGFDQSKMNSFIGSFRFLKNHFRSVYVGLEEAKGGRRSIRPTKSNIKKIEGKYPEIAKPDIDLYLLRESADEVRRSLSPHNKRNLTSFLKNFDRFETLVKEIGSHIVNPYGDRFDLLYTHVYNLHMKEGMKRFYAKYKIPVKSVVGLFEENYSNFVSEMERAGLKYLDNIGDYVFVQGQGDLPSCIKIRDLESFEVR